MTTFITVVVAFNAIGLLARTFQFGLAVAGELEETSPLTVAAGAIENITLIVWGLALL